MKKYFVELKAIFGSLLSSFLITLATGVIVRSFGITVEEFPNSPLWSLWTTVIFVSAMTDDVVRRDWPKKKMVTIVAIVLCFGALYLGWYLATLLF